MMRMLLVLLISVALFAEEPEQKFVARESHSQFVSRMIWKSLSDSLLKCIIVTTDTIPAGNEDEGRIQVTMKVMNVYGETDFLQANLSPDSCEAHGITAFRIGDCNGRK